MSDATEVLMPSMGEGITEATLVSFASLGLRVGLWGLQMCQLWAG